MQRQRKGIEKNVSAQANLHPTCPTFILTFNLEFTRCTQQRLLDKLCNTNILF